MINVIKYDKPSEGKNMGLYKSPEFYDLNFINKNYDNIGGIQVRFSGKSQKGDLKLFAEVELFMENYCEVERGGDNYFFISEPNSQFPNKIRSYKGLPFKKKKLDNDFIEKEYEVRGGETIISGLVRIKDETKFLISEQFWASGYQFILSSLVATLFTHTTLDKIINTLKDMPGNVYMEYLDVAKEICLSHDCAVIYYNIIEIELEEALCVNFLFDKNNMQHFVEKIYGCISERLAS